MEHTNGPMKRVSTNNEQCQQIQRQYYFANTFVIHYMSVFYTLPHQFVGNGIQAEESGFLKNAGVPDQEVQVIWQEN